jgi:hypothetical protein
MAPVNIKTGPISAQDRPSDIPVERWPMLVEARKSFAVVNLPYDCRELLRFVSDAREFDMIGKLGYADESDFVRRGLGLDPEAVECALSALESIKPDWAIPFREAVNLGKNGQYGKGRPKPDSFANSKANGTTIDYTLARLDRDQPELAAQVRAGKLSANAAAIQAGFRKRMVSVPATDLVAAVRILCKYYDPTEIATAAARERPDWKGRKNG